MGFYSMSETREAGTGGRADQQLSLRGGEGKGVIWLGKKIDVCGRESVDCGNNEG